MRADILDAYPELDPARVYVVGNGVDAEAYRPTPAPDVVRRLICIPFTRAARPGRLSPRPGRGASWGQCNPAATDWATSSPTADVPP